MTTMFSMTGFARAETQTPDYQLVWELKTVNHRYLETAFKLPEPLRGLEHALRDTVRSQVNRGKLDATLKLEGGQGSGSLSVNHGLLKSLINSAEEIARLAPNATPLSQSQLMSWPGVLTPSDNQLDELTQAALALFEVALKQLLDSRAEEGEKLGRLLLANLDAMAAQLEVLQPLIDDLPKLQQQRLQERLDALAVKVEDDRMAQEVALLAQKADVREELDRLTIHIEQARSMINAAGPHGRRLDFLTQELNREANTLGAKAICSELTNASVELKVIIEQIREQVQNIQ